jgi:hypothetical protein
MGSDKRRQAAGSRRCRILHDAPKFAQIDTRLPSKPQPRRARSGDPMKYLPDSLGKELVKPAITPI